MTPIESRLNALLNKVVAYQQGLADGHAAEMDELQREGVWDADDFAFIAMHEVTYTPHAVREYFHATDMLSAVDLVEHDTYMLGPKVPPPRPRVARLRELPAVLEHFFALPRPPDQLLIHIEFPGDDGVMFLGPELSGFVLKVESWVGRISSLRECITRQALTLWDDRVMDDTQILAYRQPEDSTKRAPVAMALLRETRCFTEESEIQYTCGAMDAEES